MSVDTASVIRSTAFENIDDPLDPAWIGHAEIVAERKRRAYVWSGSAALAAVLVCAVVAVVGAGSSATARAVPVHRATVDNPLALTASVAPTELAPAAPAPASDTQGPPSEADLMQMLLAKHPPKLFHADLAGVDAKHRVGISGDLSGLEHTLYFRLDQLAKRQHILLDVISGQRTHHEQVQLYRAFQQGTGNLAAPPGTSMHETGQAADVYVNGVPLADVPGVRAAAAKLGLGFPVAGEAWHVEVVSAV